MVVIPGMPASPAVRIVALCAMVILTQAPLSTAKAAQQDESKPAASPEAQIPDPSVTFKAALQAIQDDAAKQTDAAKKEYLAQLQGFLRNALQAGDEQLALAAGAAEA
jgi:hypothetical protein